MKSILILIALSIGLFCSSCDDDNPAGTAFYSSIITEEGFNLKYSDGTETINFISDELFDEKWNHVQLDHQDFGKYITFYDQNEGLRLWVNFPKSFGAKWTDEILGELDLHGKKYTNNNPFEPMPEIITELYFLSSGDIGELDFDGTIKIKRDVSVAGETYSLVGEIDGYKNQKTIKGTFWDKDFAW